MPAKEKHKRKSDDEQSVRIWSKKRYALMTLLAVAYGILVMYVFMESAFIRALQRNGGDLTTAYLSFLVLVPAGIGALSVYTIPPQHRTVERAVTVAILTGLFFCIAAGLFATGIILCVLMALPFVLIPAGIIAAISALISKATAYTVRKRKRHYAFTGFVLMLPFLMLPVESQIASPVWTRTVEDSVLINATPDTVWQHITDVETITPDEHRPSWYHTLGIPRPVQATLDGTGVGSVRQGKFNGDLAFREEITAWKVNEQMYFDVDILHNSQSTPVMRQIGGVHFDLVDGGYDIEVVSETQVRLHLHSRYHLATHFNGYAAFWADWIMHDFQRYVLQTVKARAEADAQPSPAG